MQSKKVLVADERSSSRELLRILLEHEGCEVSEASDGPQAVAIARATLPDIVFLDLDLPNLDGFTAVQAMRLDSRLKNRCIVAITEYLPNTDYGRLHQAGFSGYITKPLFCREFSDQLSKLWPRRAKKSSGH